MNADIGVIGRLKQAMAARKFSIKKLSAATSVPYRTLQNYLLGMHALPAEVLAKICAAMDVSADWIFREQLYLHPEDMKEALHRTGIAPRNSAAIDNSTAAFTLVGMLNFLNDIEMAPATAKSWQAVELQASAPQPRKRTARSSGPRTRQGRHRG